MGDWVNGVHLTAGEVFDFQALRLRQSPNLYVSEITAGT